jgi:HemY protein
MIWLLIRVAIFLAILIAATFAISQLLDTPGAVEITWANRQYSYSPLTFAGMVLAGFACLWALFWVLGLLVAVIRFVTGDETALNRFFTASRERRGVRALTQGMIALAEGDARGAMEKTDKAARLLDTPELTNLLGAQAAQKAGDSTRATDYFKALAREEKTKAIGVKGLLSQAIADGDDDRARLLAQRAFALRPKDGEVMAALFNLQTGAHDWAAARRTLAAEVRTGAMPREIGARRDAVLALAEARLALESGDLTRAREAALEANRRAPALAPAAAAAARAQVEAGSPRKAERTLRKAWKLAPHPDLAAAFAAVVPNEPIAARRKRFVSLIAENPGHPESRMLDAELGLAAEDFPAARAALGNLAETMPTLRSLAIMAAAEKGSGADEQIVRAWLARALSAPRGERWTCEACGHVHDEWAPVCGGCRGVDTLAWIQPKGAGETNETATALLPLVMGSLARPDAKAPQGATSSADDGAEDAEVVGLDADQAAKPV